VPPDLTKTADKRKILEKDVLRVILHYLTIRKVWHRRINSGAAVVEPGSPGTKRRFLRFGAPGMPDILARGTNGAVIWIECKSPTGKLTEDQKAWQRDSERFGDIYIVARKVEDVMCLFEGGKECLT
jgi:hypothetical protein